MREKTPIFSTRRTALVWLLVVLLLSIWLAAKAFSAPLFNADIITLLPQFERDRVLETSVERIRDKFGKKLIFVLDVPAGEDAGPAVNELREALGEMERSGHLNVIRHEDAISELVAFYKRLQFSFLDDDTRDLLLAGGHDSFERRIILSYLRPNSFAALRMAQDDPLLLLPSLLEKQFNKQAGALHVEDGLLVHQGEDRRRIFVFAELAASPFSLTVQDGIMTSIGRASERMSARLPDARLHVVGLLAHAHAGGQKARGEISFFGLISLAGVTLLFVGFFRSLRPLLMTIATIGVSCVAGLAACLAVFGEVNLLTLIFGVSLVGISVDYSLHYFCRGFCPRHEWSSHGALTSVLPGITLGLVTSVIGFSSLAFAPFPGVRQMALFSGVGLVSAYLCVVCWYPVLTENFKFPSMRLPLRITGAFVRFWENAGLPIKSGVLLGLLAISAVGMSRLTVQDDIRFLQKPDAQLLEVERRVGDILQEKTASQFFLVEGHDNEELLVRQESLTSSLRALEGDDRLGGHRALSGFIPSSARQREARELLRPVIESEDGSFQKIAEEIGLDAQIMRSYRAKFALSENAAVSLEDWLEDPASAPYRDLWLGRTERGVMGVVQLADIRDIGALEEIAQRQAGVHFIDDVATYTDLFKGYRRQVVLLTGISYVLVLLLLIARYGLAGGASVMLAPVLAACVSVGAVGVLGESLTLFHVMGLLLVLGIGVDYSIFFREADSAHATTALATGLSALTTILAFGLLIFSQTAAIHAFGLTLMTGIAAAFLLSPLANWSADGDRGRDARA